MNGIFENDVIGFRGCAWLIRAYDGQLVEMLCLDDGSELTLSDGVLLADDTLIGATQSGPCIADQRLLDLMTPQRRREAEFWYEHMYEVKHGVALRDCGVIAPSVQTQTIKERLEAKRESLIRAGVNVSMSKMWRMWSGFLNRGIVGCADQRGTPGHVRLSQVDPKVLVALQTVKNQFVDKSTPSKKQIIEIATWKLKESAVQIPSDSWMYVLLNQLDRGEHTTGDATSRRSHATSPDRAFGKIVALYAGDEVQLDSTPLDAMVLMADGQTCKVDLAGAIDVATKSVPTALVRPNACKSVDALELLAKSSVPQQMLPGWVESMDIARSYFPDLIAAQPQIESSLANKPVIVIRGVVVDNGKVFVSKAFLRAVEARGITYRLAPPRTPTAKPHIERFFESVGDAFVRWIRGYKGRSVNHRGRKPEKDAVWPLHVLQALLDFWIITVYQERAHSGVVHTDAPLMPLSPNQMYRALAEVAPSPARALTRDEFISMLPCEFRVINRYGVRLNGLIYNNDSPHFHAMRRTKSVNRKKNGKWEVRYDPNNVLQIWVRDQAVAYDKQGRAVVQDNGWIECPWDLKKYVSMPFGLDVLNAIRRGMSTRKITQKQILDRAEAIHRTLLGGPSARQHKQVSRAEAAAGRANLTRQQLRAARPPDEAPLQEPGSIPAPPARRSEQPAPQAEPMYPMRLSESW